MVVKQIEPQNFNKMFELAKYAFNSGGEAERKERFEMIASHSWNYGYYDDDVLTSQVMTTPFAVNILGQEMKMAGVGLVSSYPEYRGEGGINQIMQQILVDLNEKEFELSYLAPFSYPFYRRYGYEYLFEKTIYTIPGNLWPNVPKQPGKVQRMPLDEAQAAVQAVYHKMPKYQQGAVIREDWWFEYKYKFKVKGDFKFALYYNKANQVEGYLIYQMKDSQFVIVEWGYLSAEAFWSLARFIGSHNSTFSEFYFETGDTNSLNYLFPAPVPQVATKPEMMAKIVNVERFLRKLRFKEAEMELSFILTVNEDDYSSWNKGSYRVTIDASGQTYIKRTEGEALPELTGDIQSITQLLLGFRSAEELRFFNKITGDLELAKAFDERMLLKNPILEDYF